MKKELIPYFIIIVLTFLLSISVNRCSTNRDKNREPEIVIKTDTIKIVKIDTVTIIKPKPIYSKVVDTIFVKCTDTVNHYVSIPIEQKTFQGTQYKAYISGFKPQLDSINIFNKTEYIYVNKEVEKLVYQRKKNFGIGVQAGYGICGDKLSPYFGIGVSYNIIRF